MYEIKRLLRVAGLKHAFSTIEDGNQGFSFGPKDEVVGNRRRFIKASGFVNSNSCVSMVPRHPDNDGVKLVEPNLVGRGIAEPDAGPLCEALVTISPNLGLYLTAADCIPIIIYTERPQILALIHAGRESTVRGIVSATVDFIQNSFSVNPNKFVVGMGPGIRRENYLLETFPPWPAAEVKSPWRDFVEATPGGLKVDLFGYNRHLLIKKGVRPEMIMDCGIDTFAAKDDQPKFFSHRRSKATGEPEGRHACVVSMVPVK